MIDTTCASSNYTVSFLIYYQVTVTDSDSMLFDLKVVILTSLKWDNNFDTVL